jgi:ribonuclease HI
MGEKEHCHIIYTDGGCYQDIGAWAYVEIARTFDEEGTALDGRRISGYGRRISGYVYNTTNNRMEMQAIINAVHSLPAGSKVKIFSDSGYCVTGHNDPAYLKKWMYNGWKTSKKDPVENRDLWEEFIKIDMMYDVQYILIKGHSKDKNSIHKKWNDMCDQMCTQMREYATNRYTTHGVMIPHECPDNCRFHDQLGDQGGICYRCPVILCSDPDPVVPFGEYNHGWMIEWNKFFKGEVVAPILQYEREP